MLFAAIGVLLMGPALVFIGLRIRAEDGGPIFYKGERIGLLGRPFQIFKFRTMVVDAERRGGSSTSEDDPRITKAGKMLRKHKIDEIPQLINVLRGEMSFVGPRPEVRKYTDMFTDQEKAILSVRPGITDWASLMNSDEGAILKGSTDPDNDYMEKIRPEKIRLQLRYVRERSFFIDIKIILLTMKKLLSK